MNAILTLNSSVRVRGAECGIEAIILGVITSIGGFLFGYDTVCICQSLHVNACGSRNAGSNQWNPHLQGLHPAFWTGPGQWRESIRSHDFVPACIPHVHWYSHRRARWCLHCRLVWSSPQSLHRCAHIRHWQHHPGHSDEHLGPHDYWSYRCWSRCRYSLYWCTDVPV